MRRREGFQDKEKKGERKKQAYGMLIHRQTIIFIHLAISSATFQYAHLYLYIVTLYIPAIKLQKSTA